MNLDPDALAAAVASTRTKDGFGGLGPTLCSRIIEAYLEALPPVVGPPSTEFYQPLRIEPMIQFGFGYLMSDIRSERNKSHDRLIDPPKKKKSEISAEHSRPQNNED